MNRLRIVHVLHRMGTGGTELALQRIIQGLDPQLFEHVVCTVAPLSGANEMPGARLISLHRSGRKTGLLVTELSRLFWQQRPDVVHSRNWGAIESVLAARLVGVPRIIHSEHGRDVQSMHGDPLRRRLFRRLSYHLAHDLFAVSNELKEHYRRQAGPAAGKMRVIPNGVDCRRFAPSSAVRARMRSRLGISPDTLVIGSIGRLDPVKDYPTLLRAAARLITDGYSVRVVLVGSGPEQSRLESLIASTPALSSRVVMVGDSQQPDEWLNCYDIFVLPSLSEGMSNTVLEAQASALPCVVTNVGANPDLVQESKTGSLVEPGNVTEMADKIGRLLGDSRLRRMHGDHARQQVIARFGLEQMLESYSRLYRCDSPQRRLASPVLHGA